jgi:hypothetical protein
VPNGAAGDRVLTGTARGALEILPDHGVVTVFREPPSRLVATTMAIATAMTVFWLRYHRQIAEGLPTMGGRHIDEVADDARYERTTR